MTIRIAFAALCDHAVVDQQGKLSAIGIWRQVMVPQLPAVHARAHLVLLTSGRREEAGEHNISLSLHDPAGVVKLEHNGVMGMSEPPPGIEEVEAPGVLVLDLPIEAAGGHAIVVTIDGVEAARVSFQVTVQQVPQGNVH